MTSPLLDEELLLPAADLSTTGDFAGRSDVVLDATLEHALDCLDRGGQICFAPNQERRLIFHGQPRRLSAEADRAGGKLQALAAMLLGDLLARPRFKLMAVARDEECLFALCTLKLRSRPLFDVLSISTALDDLSDQPIGANSVVDTERFRILLSGVEFDRFTGHDHLPAA